MFSPRHFKIFFGIYVAQLSVNWNLMEKDTYSMVVVLIYIIPKKMLMLKEML